MTPIKGYTTHLSALYVILLFLSLVIVSCLLPLTYRLLVVALLLRAVLGEIDAPFAKDL